jgi:O-antigen/teichoic acid export membrane protein
MGANSTQAVAIVFMLIGFVLLAGAFAGGGILVAVGALVMLGVACFFFMKCKSWEYKKEGT